MSITKYRIQEILPSGTKGMDWCFETYEEYQQFVKEINDNKKEYPNDKTTYKLYKLEEELIDTL